MTCENFSLTDFQGWWRRETKGSTQMFASGAANSTLTDEYIFIDTTVSPILITTTWGTLEFPRLSPDRYDPHIPVLTPASNAFVYQNNGELVNVYNPPTSGPVSPSLTTTFGATLKLKKKDKLISFRFSNSYYIPYNITSSQPCIGVYKKLSFLLLTRPISIGMTQFCSFNIGSAITTGLKLHKKPHAQSKDFVGYKKAKGITSQFLTSGFTASTPIRKIRVYEYNFIQ